MRLESINAVRFQEGPSPTGSRAAGQSIALGRELPACTFGSKVGHRGREDSFLDISSSSFDVYAVRGIEEHRAGCLQIAKTRAPGAAQTQIRRLSMISFSNPDLFFMESLHY
jgi:hypothetical protein